MRPSVHFRDAISTFQGLCGAGYPWPSSIPLTTDICDVTCRNCKDIFTYRTPSTQTWAKIHRAHERGALDPTHPGNIVPIPPGMTVAQWDEAVTAHLAKRDADLEELAPWEDITWD